MTAPSPHVTTPAGKASTMPATMSNSTSTPPAFRLSLYVTLSLVFIAVAFLLCAALLISQHRRLRKQDRTPIRHRQNPPPVPKKDLHISKASVSSFGCAIAYNSVARSSQVHGHWVAHPKRASQSATCSAHQALQGTEALEAVRTPYLHIQEQPIAIDESPVDCRSPFRWKREPTRRLSLDLESAWPRPLYAASMEWEQERLLALRLWKSPSDDSSSLYSRPSSWCSLPNTEERGVEGLGSSLGAGPGPTIRSGAVPSRRCSIPPPAHTQEGLSCEQGSVADWALPREME